MSRMANSPSVLVAAAPLRWSQRLVELAASASHLLAADGGANHLARVGLRPSMVIGDLDSITDRTARWVGPSAMLRDPDQDRTDLEKALAYAFEKLRVDSLIVLGGLGGRIDHTIGNLGLLARFGAGERLVLEDTEHRVWAVRDALSLRSSPGETWSFWTFDPAVRVTIVGVAWPLEDQHVDAGGRPSISNVAISDQVQVRARGGSVIVMRFISDPSAHDE